MLEELVFAAWKGAGTVTGRSSFSQPDGGPVTSSGSGEGQIFLYDPRHETLQIIFVSADPAVLGKSGQPYSDSRRELAALRGQRGPHDE